MALNPDYILLPPLQNIFRDKDTGLPLRNGYILFFADNQRTIGKEVFQLTGSPPNYSYIPLGTLNLDGSWQVDLDSNGSISNGINSCNLYWYPFDDSGNVQLYFVQIYSSGGVLQYSLEAEPNFTNGGVTPTSGEIQENFVPNGQFLWHTNIPGIQPNIPDGRIQKPITNIAYGGWTFERPNSSSALDNVKFERFGSWISNPVANPRYACRISCQSPDAGNSFKDLRLKFNNVNRFSSDTDYYTYGFSAISNSGSTLTAEVILIKNFGTGGSSTTETPLATFTITTTEQSFFVSSIFGDNTGKTIGQLDDDYIQIAIRFPATNIFDASFTDALLTPGQFTLSQPPIFPETANNQFTYRSVPGFLDLADYNSKDLYLPILLSPTGLTYDTNIIGKVFSTVTNSAGVGELMCDGSQYAYSLYSTDGIPYSRLGDKLWDPVNNFYKFGTGIDFVTTTQIDVATQNLKLTTNKSGSVTNTSDGSIPTGFTFSNVKIGNSYNMNGYRTPNGVLVKMNVSGTFSAPSSATSGFTIINYRNTPQTKGVVLINNISAASGLASKYFNISNTTTSYYVWFKVDGAGTDPAPGGTGIEIDLLSSYTSNDVAQCIADALSGRQITNILCVAGSSVPAGSYFNFSTVSDSYYAWYKVDGSGSDPSPSGKIGIEIDINSSDAAAQVSLKTQISINKKYYSVPDLRGMFIRGIDNGAGIDTNDLRFNNFSNSFGDQIGTIQIDDNLEHDHGYTRSVQAGQGYNAGTNFNTLNDSNEFTTFSGASENTPINIYLNYIIKY